MLDKIMELVGSNALNEITSKAGISTDQAKQMLPLAQDSLQEGIMSQITGGNLDGLIGMFNSAGSSNGLMNNSIFNGIKGMFLQKIMKSIGLPESVAGLAAGTGMSSIIGGISGLLKSDGDNDDINASNIMNVLGGGNAGGVIGSLLGAKEGGLMDSISDVAGDLLSGKSDSKGSGGVGGMLGKLFGK